MQTQLIESNFPNFKEVIELYHSAFPEYERMDESALADWSAARVLRPLAYYDEGEFCGFMATITIGALAYILYFAVEPQRRGCGIGSRMLEQFLAESEGKTVFLSAENPDAKAPNNSERLARLKFYARHGLVLNGPVRPWRGVDYATLANAPVTSEQFENFWGDAHRLATKAAGKN